MGLDIVELVMEIEKEFQVEFENEDLEKEDADTVGGLYKLLLIKLSKKTKILKTNHY